MIISLWSVGVLVRCGSASATGEPDGLHLLIETALASVETSSEGSAPRSEVDIDSSIVAASHQLVLEGEVGRVSRKRTGSKKAARLVKVRR